MAVDSTDIASLLKNVDIKSILGSGGMTTDTSGLGGGVLGAVLIGALLPRLLGDQNSAATLAAANSHPPLTAADVTTQVGALLSMQDINEVKRDIFESQGSIQASIAAAELNNTTQTLQAEIANLQGQAALITSIEKAGDGAKDATNAIGANVINAINSTGTTLMSGINANHVAIADVGTLITANINQLNTNLLQGVNSIERTVVADGTATRALITDYNTAALNRDIVVADNRIAELLGDRNRIDGGITVTQTVNQAQAQAQAQQQQIVTNQLLTTLVGELQVAKQNIVNLGTMVGNTQAATNVKV